MLFILPHSSSLLFSSFFQNWLKQLLRLCKHQPWQSWIVLIQFSLGMAWHCFLLLVMICPMLTELPWLLWTDAHCLSHIMKWRIYKGSSPLPAEGPSGAASVLSPPFWHLFDQPTPNPNLLWLILVEHFPLASWGCRVGWEGCKLWALACLKETHTTELKNLLKELRS